MANLSEINKHYVSNIDTFLKEQRKTFPFTLSQEAEIAKYKDIHARRDYVEEKDNDNSLWESF